MKIFNKFKKVYLLNKKIGIRIIENKKIIFVYVCLKHKCCGDLFRSMQIRLKNVPKLLYIHYNYLCTSKYYGHVYNFLRRANPLRGGLGLGTQDICGANRCREFLGLTPPSILFGRMKKL